MDCSAARRLIDLELDGELAPSDALALETHAASCSDCRRERQLLLAVDRVLADAPLERAPEGFEEAVRGEIIRRAEVRHRIDTVAVPAACAAAAVAAGYGIHRLVNWEAARRFFEGLGDSATQLASPVTEQLAAPADVASAMPSEQGAFGAAIALAVVAVVFLGVTTWKLLRQNQHSQHEHGWR